MQSQPSQVGGTDSQLHKDHADTAHHAQVLTCVSAAVRVVCGSAPQLRAVYLVMEATMLLLALWRAASSVPLLQPFRYVARLLVLNCVLEVCLAAAPAHAAPKTAHVLCSCMMSRFWAA